jgi:hypothetical protein
MIITDIQDSLSDNLSDIDSTKYIQYLNDKNILNIIFIKDVSDILNNFFNNIDINQHSFYYKSLDNITYNIFENYELYSFLINCINFSNNIINEKKDNNNNISELLLYSNIWKIYVYDNMMWNLPFTLSDIIFIPINYIKSSCKIKSYYKLTKTIIHERIHVSQRANILKWNNYIENNIQNNISNKWIKITKDNNIFNFIKNYNFYELFNNINVINPDTCYEDFYYLYKNNDELYYGLFILENNNPVIKWLKINNNNNNFYFEKINLNLNKEEHPFEYYAYKLSDEYVI